MQSKTNSKSGLAKRVELKINEKETKILRLNNRKMEPVKLEGKDIEDVDEFTYLGAVVSKEGGGGKDMDSRLNKARAAFTKLNKVWNSNQISRKTKIKLYKSIVRPVLLYGCETWKIIKSDERKLDSFQFKCLKRIMRIFWPNIVSIDELNKLTQNNRISQEVKKRRWKWIGHVLRKPRNHHCMVALTWHPDGRRKVW